MSLAYIPHYIHKAQFINICYFRNELDCSKFLCFPASCRCFSVNIHWQERKFRLFPNLLYKLYNCLENNPFHGNRNFLQSYFNELDLSEKGETYSAWVNLTWVIALKNAKRFNFFSKFSRGNYLIVRQCLVFRHISLKSSGKRRTTKTVGDLKFTGLLQLIE